MTELEQMLVDGWEIAGYSVSMMAAGALVHSTLLRKDTKLTAVSVGFNGAKELGRNVNDLTAITVPKKGFFG